MKTEIEKYIDEYYSDYINLGEINERQNYNGIQSTIVSLKDGDWYIRFWSPVKRGGKPQLEYCRKEIVYHSGTDTPIK